MHKLMRTVAILSAATLAACSGGGADTSGSGGLQPADVEQITNGIVSGLGSISSGMSSATRSGALVAGTTASDALTATANVNAAAACPAAGHVTTKGNVTVTCPDPPATGACTVGGAIGINYGDRTNNLDDCTFSNGLVIDGTVYVTISGSASGASVTMTETLNGHLELDRKGPTGGLVPLDSCFIFLTARVPERTVTGTICGQAVNRTF